MLIIIIVTSTISASIAFAVAKSKGRRQWVWAIASFLLWPCMFIPMFLPKTTKAAIAEKVRERELDEEVAKFLASRMLESGESQDE